MEKKKNMFSNNVMGLLYHIPHLLIPSTILVPSALQMHAALGSGPGHFAVSSTNVPFLSYTLIGIYWWKVFSCWMLHCCEAVSFIMKYRKKKKNQQKQQGICKDIYEKPIV